MTSQPGRQARPAEPAEQHAAHRADVALRSFGQPNSIGRQFDFLDGSYEGRRLFAEVLGTFLIVLVAVGLQQLDQGA
jgi:aquaporin Z